MIIHQREVRYSHDYADYFKVLTKAKEHLEKRFPEVSVVIMYNLAGSRGWATIQTHYPSLADYERIDAEMDNDLEYCKLLSSIMGSSDDPPVDQFYRVIKDF